MHKSKYIPGLVSSINPSEKGYIKKYFNLNTQAFRKHNTLFGLIEKNKEDSEESLRQKSGLKNYDEIVDELFEIILTCLENYHVSQKKEIRSLLNRIEILTEKNLYHQAEKLVEKVKILTEKHKFYELYSEAADWEITLLGPKPPTDQLLKTYDKIFEKLEENIVNQENEMNQA
ncbi:MAG TPA: hypothetical protein VNX68_13535 [Nitrosopumilaceae archaeon]|nr:hypothetical protein [Nitrosopumilaceae archaeon]